MKYITSFFAFFALFQSLFAQAIVPDAGFGQNGRIRSSLHSSPSRYSEFWNINSNGEIILFPEGVSKGSPLFTKYSMYGDSLETVDYDYGDQALSYLSTTKAQSDDRFLLAGIDTTGLIMFRFDGTRDSTFGINGKAKTYYNHIFDICFGQDKRIYTAGTELNGFGVLPKGGNVIAYSSPQSS